MTNSINETQKDTFWDKIVFLIFSNKEPDAMIKVSFYLSLTLWTLFFAWSLLSFGAIYFRETIQNIKQIAASDMINKRGLELGFDSGEFVDRLLIFHTISIIAWIFVFIGIIMIWRQVSNFVYFFFGGTALYFLTMILYMNIDYYLEDTTFFDKIAFIALNLIGVISTFFIKSGKSENSRGLFGEDL